MSLCEIVSKDLPEKIVVMVSVVKARLASIGLGRNELEEGGEGEPIVAGPMDCVFGKEKDVGALEDYPTTQTGKISKVLI